MKLSPEAIDNILHVIATFDRERGVPHDYHDLEVVLKNTTFSVAPSGALEIAGETVDAQVANPSMRIDGPLDDSHEAKALLLEAARSWKE